MPKWWLVILVGLLGAPTGLAAFDEEAMARLIDPDKLGILTVAQEALAEPFEGKLAVAEVIHNRMRQKYMSDGTVEGTVLRAYQFSGWLPGDPVLVKSLRWDDTMPAIQECIKAWFDAKQGSNTVQNAVLYYNPAMVKTPKWARPEHATEVATVGAHVFFVPKPTAEA